MALSLVRHGQRVASSTLIAHSADKFDSEPSANSAVNSTVVWLGGESGKFGYIGYAGFVSAMNGDLGSDDLLLRMSGSFGEYQYDTVGTEINIDNLSGDIMLGYQAITNEYIASIYAGVDFQKNTLTPSDPNNSTAGSEVGFKVQGELRLSGNEIAYLNLLGNYSTANSSYFTRARLGFNIGNGLSAGPEFVLLGNDEFDGNKIGGFVNGIQLGDLNMSINAGYAKSDGRGSRNGIYGGVAVSFLF